MRQPVPVACVLEGRKLKTPATTTAMTSAPYSANSTGSVPTATARKFTGTDNPRHLRAIHALLRRPVSRQELDSVAGAANSPELVAELRRRGLDAPCERISFIDCDGNPCRPGVYSFTIGDRRAVYAWLAKRAQRGQA